MKSFVPRVVLFSAFLALAAISLHAWTVADDRYPGSQTEPLITPSSYPPGIQVESVQVTLIKQVVVPAEEAGVIDSAMVKEGDLVKEGDILARIGDAEAQLERRKAQIDMDIAELRSKNDVNIRYAKKSSEVMEAELKRSEEAVALVKTAVSKTELDRQRLAVQKTALEIEQAEMDLKEQDLNYQLKANEYALATRAVERREIRSPISGKIVEVSKQRGEWVEPGNQVFRIVEIDRLRVKGYLNINQLLGISEGRPVSLFIDVPGRPRLEFPGKLVFISPEVNEVNGEQVEIWAEVENKNLTLRPGMHGTLVIQNPEVAAKR
jgi:macrolide-specific efflux system membrane fusion protein